MSETTITLEQWDNASWNQQVEWRKNNVTVLPTGNAKDEWRIKTINDQIQLDGKSSPRRRSLY